MHAEKLWLKVCTYQDDVKQKLMKIAENSPTISAKGNGFYCLMTEGTSCRA